MEGKYRWAAGVRSPYRGKQLSFVSADIWPPHNKTPCHLVFRHLRPLGASRGPAAERCQSKDYAIQGEGKPYFLFPPKSATLSAGENKPKKRPHGGLFPTAEKEAARGRMNSSQTAFSGYIAEPDNL
ncbi:unnamed protein product [Lota lota]